MKAFNTFPPMPNSFFTNNPFSNHMLDTLQPVHTRPLTPPSSLHSLNHSNPHTTPPLFFSHPLLSINTLSTAIDSFSFSTNNPILCSFTLHMQHSVIPVINEFQHITQCTGIVSVLQVHPQYHPFPKHSHHDHGQEEALDTLPLPIDRRRNTESNGPKCPKRVSMNVHVPFCDSGHSGLFTPSSWGTAKTPVQHTLSAMRPLLVDIP